MTYVGGALLNEPLRKESHLHVVDPDTGEIRCPNCSSMEDQVAGLEKDLRAWRARYADLHRDKEGEAQMSPVWPKAIELFRHWQVACNHPRAGWSVERFWLCEPHLKKYGFDVCVRAIDGYAFDCFITVRRNGTRHRHDGWELIFRDAAHVEEGANKAPKEGQQ